MLIEPPVPGTEDQAKSRLVEAIRAEGSGRVFAQAYKERTPRWRSYVLWRVPGDAAFAEDVVHDAALATLQAKPNFTAVAAVDSYVRDSIQTVLRNFFRDKPLAVGIDAKEAPELPWDGPSPRRTAWRDERALLLREVFRKVPPEEQEAFELHCLAGNGEKWTLDAIAKKQAVTPQTVSNRIRRLRARFLAAFDTW